MEIKEQTTDRIVCKVAANSSAYFVSAITVALGVWLVVSYGVTLLALAVPLWLITIAIIITSRSKLITFDKPSGVIRRADFFLFGLVTTNKEIQISNITAIESNFTSTRGGGKVVVALKNGKRSINKFALYQLHYKPGIPPIKGETEEDDMIKTIASFIDKPASLWHSNKPA